MTRPRMSAIVRTPASHALFDANTPVFGKPGSSRLWPAMTTMPPKYAKLKNAGVKPMTAMSTSREAIASVAGTAASKNTSSASMPASAK